MGPFSMWADWVNLTIGNSIVRILMKYAVEDAALAERPRQAQTPALHRQRHPIH